MVSRICLTVAFGFGVCLLSTASYGSDWPQFRGPNGNGVSDDKELPSEWGVDKNLKWKAPIPGVGWSAPIVSGDKIFVTTAVTEKQTKPKWQSALPDNKLKKPVAALTAVDSGSVRF